MNNYIIRNVLILFMVFYVSLTTIYPVILSQERDVLNKTQELTQEETIISEMLNEATKIIVAQNKEIEKMKSDMEAIKKLENRTWGIVIGGFLVVLVLYFSQWNQILKAKKAVDKYKDEIEKLKQGSLDSIRKKCSEEYMKIEKQLDQKINEIQDKLIGASELSTYINNGKYLYSTGNVDSAIELFSLVIKKQYDHPEARKFRGLCYARKGQNYYPQALADLNIAVRNDECKNDADANFALARLYYSNGAWDKAIDRAEKAILYDSDNKADALCIIGGSYRRNREFKKAIEKFKEVLASYPKHAHAIVGIGYIYKDKKDFNNIIDWYSEAIDLFPKNANFYIYRAWGYWNRNRNADRKKAWEDLDASEKLTARNHALWITKGNFFYESNEINNAIIAYEKGLEVTGLNRRPLFRNALCRCYIKINKIDKAIEVTKDGIVENPHFTANYMALASAYMISKNYPKASEICSKSLDIAHDFPGKIWSIFFLLISELFQGYEPIKLKRYIVDFYTYLMKAPYFDSEKWDFSNIEEHVIANKKSLSDKNRKFISCLLKTIEEPKAYLGSLKEYVNS